MSNPARTTAERLKDAVLNVTKDWAKQRKAEERHASALANRHKRLVRASDYYNFKSAAYVVMEQAYLAASANGTLPALARQVMYQARPFIQDKMGGQQLNDQYFCQQLLPNYIAEFSVDWDVVYDDRGHFIEPHTQHSIGLGTIGVRNYIAGISLPKLQEPGFAPGHVVTQGPDGCFGAVLFIEKEGFLPLLEAVHLAERYDLAIMSTKGLSNTAARILVDHICGGLGMPLFVLHDFDKSGFSILGTLQRATRRFSFRHRHLVIDLGLRLADVEELGLESEAAFDRGDKWARRANLRENGASEKEIEFLIEKRVELNALTSDQLVAFIERKLEEHGVKKIIPNKEQLDDAYRLFVRNKRVEKIIKEALQEEDDSEIQVPGNLKSRVKKYLTENPVVQWDDAVAAIAADEKSEKAS
jgi:hypothetical protein